MFYIIFVILKQNNMTKLEIIEEVYGLLNCDREIGRARIKESADECMMSDSKNKYIKIVSLYTGLPKSFVEENLSYLLNF